MEEKEYYVRCVACRQQVKVKNPKIEEIEVKYRSYRRFLRGFCGKCNKKITTIMKNDEN